MKSDKKGDKNDKKSKKDKHEKKHVDKKQKKIEKKESKKELKKEKIFEIIEDEEIEGALRAENYGMLMRLLEDKDKEIMEIFNNFV